MSNSGLLFFYHSDLTQRSISRRSLFWNPLDFYIFNKSSLYKLGPEVDHSRIKVYATDDVICRTVQDSESK